MKNSLFQKFCFGVLFTGILHISVNSASAQNDYSPGFSAGKPSEMERLDFLTGEWNISLKWTNDLSLDKKEWIDAGQSKSRFSKMYDGTFVMEESDGFPLMKDHEGFSSWAYTSIYSFDRFQGKYRYVAFDNILGLADIYEAESADDNLTFSNQFTGTYNNMGTDNSNQKNMFIINKLSDSSFELTWYNIDESKLGQSETDDWNFVIYMLYEKIE